MKHPWILTPLIFCSSLPAYTQAGQERGNGRAQHATYFESQEEDSDEDFWESLLTASDDSTSSYQEEEEGQLSSPSPQQMDPEAISFNDKNVSGFYIGADFIYWKAEEEGLEFAINGLKADTFQPNPPFTSVSKGKLYSPDFEWEPGFKIQIGYCSDDWAWDTYLNWTWLHADADGRAKGPNAYNDNTLYTLWNPTLYLFNISRIVSSHWDMHYNTLDGIICRSFAIGKHFSVKPLAGVRGAWIHQTYDIKNTGVGPGNIMQIHNRGNFTGAGLIAGISASWFFSRHFSLFSDTAFSLVYGQIESDVKVNRTVSAFNINGQTVVHFDNQTHSVKQEIETGIGLRYETGLARERYHFALDVKWEYVNWFNMNTFLLPLSGTAPNVPSPTTPTGYSGSYGRLNGNLGLMGLTVGAKFSF